MGEYSKAQKVKKKEDLRERTFPKVVEVEKV
jgi:hypothetical protein